MTRKLFAPLMATIAFASIAVAENQPSISDETGPAICIQWCRVFYNQ